MARGLCAMLALGIGACSRGVPATGRVVVAITIDWEGAYLSADGLDAIDAMRARVGGAPVTHFVSAAYFTKDPPDPGAARTIAGAIRPGDEVAAHLHAWRSLARAAGVEPRSSPSYLTGTDELLAFDDGDAGFDLDLDTYTGPELRSLLRASRRLLETAGIPVSRSFRAGGYLGTPRVLQAVHDEGVAVDSSAIDPRRLDAEPEDPLPRRLAEIWHDVDAAAAPRAIGVAGGAIVELPIAAIADNASQAELVEVLASAHARLAADPDRDVFVVLALHQETAADFTDRVAAALEQVGGRDETLITTIEHAAGRARLALGVPPD